MFKELFGGYIYYDKSQNGYYKWTIQSENDILNFINNYVKYNCSRTVKFHRLMLCKKFFELYKLKAYKQNNTSILYKAWLLFNKKWDIN
jgi:ubiquinol-cytochrome c reductase cytochrome b subunit